MKKSAPRPRKAAGEAALYRAANESLTSLLTIVLKTSVLRKRAGIRLKKTGQVSLGLEVSLVSASDMKSLNRKFRKKNRPTDVLSFPAPKVFRESGYLGDLIICLPVMKEQAKEQKHPVKTELQVLLTHGLLHLLDFDHERGEKDARDMARWEAKLLAELGTSTGLISR